MSPGLIESLAHTFSIALAGAVVNHCGSCAAADQPVMRASGWRLCSFTAFSLARTSALAPSLIDEALAAVIVPSFANAGLSDENLDGSLLPGPSSSFTAIG